MQPKKPTDLFTSLNPLKR